MDFATKNQVRAHSTIQYLDNVDADMLYSYMGHICPGALHVYTNSAFKLDKAVNKTVACLSVQEQCGNVFTYIGHCSSSCVAKGSEPRLIKECICWCIVVSHMPQGM